jgi:carbon-monoxide dehydrogenase medium subunit
VVLGGVGPLPVEVGAAALAGQPATEQTWRAMGEHAASQIDPPEDTHGDAAYRRRLTATLVARALAEAACLPRASQAAGPPRSSQGSS